MSTIAIVPARAGSKGIKGKNIVPFLGAPLIGHTLVQAQASEKLDHVFVSTDGEEIAQVSREYGVDIIRRPEELAGDQATTESALLHALEEIRQNEVSVETVVLLQCTSPLRRAHDIDEAISLVKEEEFDSALSCCENHNFLWQGAVDDGVEPINYDPQNRARRQDFAMQYQENGSIYVMDVEILDQDECRLGGKIGVHKMPELLSFEIDEPKDLDIVRSMAEATDEGLVLADG